MAINLNATLPSIEGIGSHRAQPGILSAIQQNIVLSSCLAIVLALYVLGNACTPRTDPGEPPLVAHQIPFVGHLLGILTHGISYFANVAQNVGKPIFTLPILNGKVYVVASPELVTACMRDTRNLSFNPFIVEVFRRLAGLSAADVEITRHNMDSKTVPSYMSDMHRVEYAALAPGPALDNMFDSILSVTASSLQSLPDNSEIDLYKTVTDFASLAMFRSTYGPDNPFDINPELFKDFWLFERNLKWLLINICPSLLAPRAYRARARLTQAFVAYYQNSSSATASTMIQHRLAVAQKYHQPLHTIAAFDVGLCFGLLSNTIPTLFWSLVHTLADPALLQRIRDETAHLVDTTSDLDAVTVDLRSEKHLRRACPLITSTFHETLRVISAPLSSGRYVLHDTVLSTVDPVTGNKTSHLLRAGSMVQIPSYPLHHPPTTTTTTTTTTSSSTSSSSSPPSTSFPPTTSPFARSDNHTFDPERFTRDLPAKHAAEPERHVNGSFRAFGGGATLCPGRKLAFVEIVGFVVMWVHLFDFLDEDGSSVKVPGMEVSKVTLAMSKPREEERVVGRLRWRDGLAGRKVVVRVGGERDGEGEVQAEG